MATQIAAQFHATEKKTSLLTGGQHSMLDREILQQQADAPIDAGQAMEDNQVDLDDKV